MANIIFEKIKIHNFLSFGDAELDFRNKGYVLVSGTNKNPRDGAISNGSGKSSIWSAISWALTGETIQGLSTNICNINMPNEGCWVELTFKIMEDEYKITRYKDFGGKKGSDLKIFINKEDKSGDGVRKSEALLAQYIPDLTSSLIGSVIILGQGLPHRFTNNTPSGRKEVLEKLSKSDFMIEDIKSRISKRSKELAEVKRTLEDDLLTVTTEQKVFMSEKDKETNKLLAYAVMPNFDEEINNNEVKINKIEKEIEEIEKIILEITSEQESANSKLFQLSTKKSSELDAIKDVYNDKLLTIKNIISELESDKKHLLAEITKYDNIKDVCPTCGQKIPGVCKHDTTSLKLELETILKEQTTNQTQIDTLTKTYNADISTINTKYVNDEDEIKATLVSLKNKKTEQTSLLNSKTTEKSSLFSSVLQLKNNKSTFESNKKKIEDTIKSINDTLISIDNKILYINKESEILNSHILAVDKMNTLVKRDFRGFLLTHVIDFINIKAKEYCSYVFETDEIEFKLDGNSIDISYCGKDYENLSGGEKQKVDLIIQFSIRDMLCQYLNFSSNILVLDEITDNLDSKGSEKIVNFISNKLTDIESVFIITHHTELLKGLFESEIHVEKDENGVSKIK
jgi:DNA repair exonuclease SbcCD ATPase subunit